MLRRRKSFRDPAPRLLVVCEGESTEPQYLYGLRDSAKNPLVSIRVVRNGGDPLGVVSRAIRDRDEAAKRARREGDPFLEYNAVWCVFDVDSHAHLRRALADAAANGLLVAVSSPAFELWLLLHFADRSAHTSVTQARNLLRAHVNDYDKRIDFRRFIAGYNDAVARARQLQKVHAQNFQHAPNPSTSVHLLTESVRGDKSLTSP